MERKPCLLTGPEIAEIREGLGLRGPVLTKWAELLLADHDERVRLEQERDTKGNPK